MIINAIETSYKDYRMRSRTEARWAVFFDALGIRWVYEPEGFDLGPAGWYLPDFWLPDLALWCEIKGAEPPAAELRKLHALAEGQGTNVLLLVGEPGAPEEIADDDPAYRYELAHRWSYAGRLFVGDYPRAEALAEHFFETRRHIEALGDFLACKVADGRIAGPVPQFDGAQATLQRLLDLDRQYYRAKYGKAHPQWEYGYIIPDLYWREARPGQWALAWAEPDASTDQMTPALLAAYRAARSARFEHGEQPMIERAPAPAPAPALALPATGWRWRRSATHTIAELASKYGASLLAGPDLAGEVAVLAGRLVAIQKLPAEEQGTVLRGQLLDGTGDVRLKVPPAVYAASAEQWVPGQRVLLTGRLVPHAGDFAGITYLEGDNAWRKRDTIFEVQAVQELPI